jgi:hypothetical protein
MQSYYSDNRKLVFRIAGDFQQNISLTELEDMLPFERTVYMLLIHQKIEEHSINTGKP